MLFVNEEAPRISGSIRRTFGDGSILNANAAFALFHLDLGEDGFRTGPGQPDRTRILREREREYNYEFGGDYEFGLGGGRLKLIGVHRFEHSPYRQTLTIDFSDGRPREGQRFTQTADEAETILRGEYRWRGGRNEWQVEPGRRAQPPRRRQRPVLAQPGRHLPAGRRRRHRVGRRGTARRGERSPSAGRCRRP